MLGAAFVAFVLASLKLAGGRTTRFDLVAAFALAAGFGPLTSALALGQVALVACAGIAGSLLAQRRDSRAGAFAGALLAALQPNLAVVLLAQLRERRAAPALGAAALVAAAAGLWAAGSGAFARYLATLTAHAAAERFIAIQTTPAAIAFALGASEPAAQALGVALALAAVGILVVQLLSQRYDVLAGTALACAALPFALPFSHEADLALVFFPAVLCLRRARGSAWLAALTGTLLVALNWLDFAQRTTPLATTLALALCAALGALALGREGLAGMPRPTLALVPLATFAAVAGAWTMSTAHPLPVWPDALPADFHATLIDSAARVWHDEQVFSGLAARNPWSGFLRLLSLLGCVALWAAASFALTEPASALPTPSSEPLSSPRRRPAASDPSC